MMAHLSEASFQPRIVDKVSVTAVEGVSTLSRTDTSALAVAAASSRCCSPAGKAIALRKCVTAAASSTSKSQAGEPYP